MKLLKSYDEYKELIREFRKTCKRPFSNIYYMPDDIERYVRMGRASYEKQESGIIFFFDEELYYRVCLYVDDQQKFVVEKQGKKILIKNVYKGERKESLQRVEQQLVELGFRDEGTSVEIRGETSTIFEKCEQIRKYIGVLEKRGYRCVKADSFMANEIEKLMLDSDIIKDYQLEFKSDEEKEKMIDRGCYLCIIDRDNQVCAGGICDNEGEVSQGVAVIVKEEYKMQGFAPVLAYYRCKWWYENNIKHARAWILTNNDPSLMYHRSLGYKFTDMYTDEWILDM